MMRRLFFYASLPAALLATLVGCDIGQGAIRDDYSYRLTVIVEGTFDPPVVDVLNGDPALIGEEPPGSGIFVLEETPDYSADPHLIEIRVSAPAELIDDQFLSVTVTYRELGTIPTGVRTLFSARREAGDGRDPLIHTVIVAPQ